MKKLAALISCGAYVLNVAEKSAAVRVTMLRKAKPPLWTSLGRGISPDPTPSDATNFLLSWLGGGLATKVAETVRTLRGSKLEMVLRNGEDIDAPPPVAFYAKLLKDHTLGDVLDRIFAELAETGDLVTTSGDYSLSSLNFAVEQNFLGRRSTLSLNDGSARWEVSYQAYPELEGAAQEEWTPIARRLKEAAGDRTTTEAVTLTTFVVLAECISGRVFEEDEEAE